MGLNKLKSNLNFCWGLWLREERNLLGESFHLVLKFMQLLSLAFKILWNWPSTSNMWDESTNDKFFWKFEQENEGSWTLIKVLSYLINMVWWLAGCECFNGIVCLHRNKSSYLFRSVMNFFLRLKMNCMLCLWRVIGRQRHWNDLSDVAFMSRKPTEVLKTGSLEHEGEAVT